MKTIKKDKSHIFLQLFFSQVTFPFNHENHQEDEEWISSTTKFESCFLSKVFLVTVCCLWCYCYCIFLIIFLLTHLFLIFCGVMLLLLYGVCVQVFCGFLFHDVLLCMKFCCFVKAWFFYLNKSEREIEKIGIITP
jgi:hypothetical protein